MRPLLTVVARLDPDPDEARRWVEAELAKDDYQDRQSLLQRALAWLSERLADLQNHQGDGGQGLPPIAIIIVAVVLLLAVAYLLTRVRRERRTVVAGRAVLGDIALTADQLRQRAAAAEADGRLEDAVLDLTRAMARDADARTLLSDAPSLTAHEIGRQLSVVFPELAGEVNRAMDRFDDIAYGGGGAAASDVADTRRTDDALRRARPRLPERPRPPRPDDAGPTAGADADGAARSVWTTGVGV